MTSVRIDGSVTVRPLRIGVVDDFKSKDSLRRFVRISTNFWGGAGFFGLPPDDENRVNEFGISAGIDAITTFSESDFPTFRALPGFTYNNFERGDPFGPGESGINLAALKADAFSEHSFSRRARGGSRLYTFVNWKDSHPLSELLWCLYGCPEIPNTGLDAERFSLLELADTDSIPKVDWSNSQLGVTCAKVINRDSFKINGIVRVRTGNVQDLISFWNLRAMGLEVIPWPEDNSALAEDYANDWIKARGSEFDQHHFLHVFGDADSNLEAFLSRHNLDQEASSKRTYIYQDLNLLPDWVRVTPFESSLKRSFSVDFDESAWSFKVPLPRIDNLTFEASSIYAGQVVADISINWTDGLPIDRNTAVPVTREFASKYLRQRISFLNPICRPNENGLFVSMDAQSEYFDYPLISSLDLSNRLFKHVEIDSSISDAQGYGTAIIKRLGGIGPDSASLHPAVRRVLYWSQQSTYGKPRQFLLGKAKENQGDWATQFQFTQVDYPNWVLRFLASRGLLQAVLKIHCLSCRNTFTISAESIDHEVTCSLCGDIRKIALHISGANPEWLLKFGGDQHFYEKMSEMFPVMGAISLISGIEIGGLLGLHFTTGTKIKKSGLDCEIDLFLAFREEGSPVYVVGECKSYTDPFDSDDIAHLQAIQLQFQSKGLECWILFATLREELSDDEIALFHSAFGSVPSISDFRAFKSVLDPIAPIILTKANLSAGGMSDASLLRKVGGRKELSKLSVQSCVENLGLSSFSFVEGHFELNWRTSPLDIPGTL